MKCGRASKINLHTEMMSLRREISMTLGENHLLKVKIRRLEYELNKKDKYMNHFLINSEKQLESQNLVYKRTSNRIMKLKKENEDLKELLFKRESSDQRSPYRTKMTTVSCDQVDNKIKNSIRSQSNFSSRLENLSDSHTLNKTNIKPQRIFSTNSRSVETTENFLNNYFVTRVEADKLMEMINVLKKEQDIDKDIIHARNSEITKLTSELKDLKSQFSAKKISLLKRSSVSGTSISPKNVNSSLEPDKQFTNSDFIHPKTPSKGLEPVQELNENESSDTSNRSDMNVHKQKLNLHKTIIEYDIDSDVSSDEEIYVLNA